MVMGIFLKNLGKIRSFYGWNMDDMYKHLDFGKSTFYNWKSGKSKPSMDMLEQIARNANVTLSDLLWEGFSPGEPGKERTERFYAHCRQMDQRIRRLYAQLLMEFSDILTDIASTEKEYEQNGTALTPSGISADL